MTIFLRSNKWILKVINPEYSLKGLMLKLKLQYFDHLMERSNQSMLMEISPEYSLEGLMLKLKLQSFGHLMGRTDSLEKTVMLGKIEGRRRRG